MKRRYVIVVVLACGAIVSQGKVFFRWGSRTQSNSSMEAAGGSLAYETSVKVNGGNGRLAVFSFDRPISEVVKKAGQVFDTDAFDYSGGTMGFATVESAGRVLRLVAVQLPGPRQTVIFKLDQSASDFKASLMPPSNQLLDSVPVYPGSRPTFFVRDEKTRTSMCASRVEADAVSVREFYESSLSGSGWVYALSPTKPSVEGMGLKGSALGVYLRGQEICCLFVDSTQIAGETRITLLHKQQGMK